jgi:hypothetical protein
MDACLLFSEVVSDGGRAIALLPNRLDASLTIDYLLPKA